MLTLRESGINIISETHAKIGLRLAYYVEFEYNKAQTKALCKSLDITLPVLNKLLEGKREVSLSEIIKLGEWFSVPITDIISCKF